MLNDFQNQGSFTQDEISYYQDRIKEILDHDLNILQKQERTVKTWFKIFGQEKDFQQKARLLTYMNNIVTEVDIKCYIDC